MNAPGWGGKAPGAGIFAVVVGAGDVEAVGTVVRNWVKVRILPPGDAVIEVPQIISFKVETMDHSGIQVGRE